MIQPRPALLDQLFLPLANLHGLGHKFAPLLARLSGERIKDLLLRFTPHKIIIRQETPMTALKDDMIGQQIIVKGKVTHHVAKEEGFSNRPYKIYLKDGTALLTVNYFRGQGEWLRRQYPPASCMVISGTLNRFQGEWQITHPSFALNAARAADIPRREPVYPASKNLPQRIIQKAVQEALAMLPSLPEWLPAWAVDKYTLPAWRDALTTLHQPTDMNDLAATSPAVMRLALDEMIAWQLAIKTARHGREQTALVRNWLLPKPTLFARIDLPFSLTTSQQEAIAEIEANLQSPHKMARLLMGDVGSGKTIIALYAMLRVVEKNFVAPAGGKLHQAALLAPTEILAEQHYRNFDRWLRPLGITPVLLTGRLNKKEREERRAMIEKGHCAIVVGTHALIQDDVTFANLRLTVIDEQQRFGVLQRLALYQKSLSPDLLLMSATPIPRTLSLVAFGDLDISTLKEKPHQADGKRQVIETAIVNEDRLSEVMARVIERTNQGASVFWVCPLIEESELRDWPSAEARYAWAKKYFPENQLALLHGQMKPRDKQNIIDAFRRGEIKLLIATTVIENGIDIPRANIIIIDHANHFGLTQLHQLRGRVGRDQIQGSDTNQPQQQKAFCILLYHPPLGELAEKRLTAIKEHDDGFYLAEKDLEWRGMGDRYGLRQSGFGDFRFFDLFFHQELLRDATRIADDIIAHHQLEDEAIRLLLTLQEKDKAIGWVEAG